MSEISNAEFARFVQEAKEQREKADNYFVTLRAIAEYQPEEPVDEWSEAQAFHAVRRLARETLKA
jgi:hypothetical protein